MPIEGVPGLIYTVGKHTRGAIRQIFAVRTSLIFYFVADLIQDFCCVDLSLTSAEMSVHQRTLQAFNRAYSQSSYPFDLATSAQDIAKTSWKLAEECKILDVYGIYPCCDFKLGSPYT